MSLLVKMKNIVKGKLTFSLNTGQSNTL